MRSPKNPSSFIWSWRLVDFSSFPLARIGEVSFEKFRRSCNVCPYSFLLATVGPCRNRAFRRSGANRESDEGVKEKGGKCWKGNRAREVKRERIGRRTSKERWILEGLSIYYSKIDSLLEVWARNDFRATGAASTCLLYLFRPVFSSLSALSLSLQSHRQCSISVAFSRPPPYPLKAVEFYEQRGTADIGLYFIKWEAKFRPGLKVRRGPTLRRAL